LFDVRGDGLVVVHQGGITVDADGMNVTGLTTLKNGLDVVEGGIEVQAGGLDVIDGGAVISTTGSGTVMYVTTDSSASPTNVLSVDAPFLSTADASVNLLRVDGVNETVFKVAGDGTVTVARDLKVGTNASDLITFTGSIYGSTPFILEGGDASDGLSMQLQQEALTADQTIIIPDTSGTFVVINGDFPNGRVHISLQTIRSPLLRMKMEMWLSKAAQQHRF